MAKSKSKPRSGSYSSSKSTTQAKSTGGKPTTAGASKAQAQAKPAPKHRNTLLTVALVLIVLHGLFMFGVFWNIAPTTERTLTSVAVWTMLIGAVLDVVAAVLMWYWKRWGIYLYIVSALAAAIAGLMASGSLLFVFSALLPAIVVLYIIAMQRDKFE